MWHCLQTELKALADSFYVVITVVVVLDVCFEFYSLVEPVSKTRKVRTALY
jgi:hypothetical protein